MKKIGIYTGIGYPVSLEERLSLIKETGFDFVCLNFEKELLHTETQPENQVRLAEKYAFPVHAAHLTGENMTSIWKNCDMAEYVTGRLIDELKLISELCVPVGVAHITWGYEAPEAPSKDALSRFERIAEAAEKYNVYLALENSVFAEQVHFVLENITSSHVGFCYDSGHENAFTPGENYLQKYKDRLFATHLHDNDGKNDNHFPPFHPYGTIDWQKTAKMLNQTTYGKEYIALEPGMQSQPIQEMLTSSYEAGKKLAEIE